MSAPLRLRRDGIFGRRGLAAGDDDRGRLFGCPLIGRSSRVEFGLIPNWPEDEGEPLSISLQPGDYMAFFEPWDSGDYDT